jgi:toxin ParE1/3/4
VRVVIARAAERDLFAIQRHIAADSPVRAASFVSDLERLCTNTLGASPYIGAARDEISPGLRVHPHKGYMICYRVKSDVVRVVRIFHASYDVTRRF